jgi:branched-chain amino acid transport system substrate-binding protein
MAMRTAAWILALAAWSGAGSAAAQAVVKIGHAGPLTGPIAHIGKDGENGARLALEDANAAGITLGGQKVRFELASEDDQADPRTATTVAQRLTDAGVRGVVGHATSGASIPASRIYEQAGIPMITPSATSPRLTRQGYRTVFRVIANDLQQGAAMARYAAEVLKLKKVAVVDDRSAYGQGLADAFADQAKGLGVEVVGREFTSDKATDFMAILTRLKARAPEAVFYGGMDPQAAPLLRQMRQLGMTARFLGGDGACTAEMIKLAGAALTDTAYCTQAGLPMERMPGGAAFNARFRSRFNTGVQLYAPYAYDAATALVKAMAAAGSADPAKYLPAMQTLSFAGITGPIAFDERGDVKDGGVTLYRYDNGAWVPLQ